MSTTEKELDINTSSGRTARITVGILKIVELCFIIVCIGLVDDPATHTGIRPFIAPRTLGLCYATFGAFLIYTAVYLIMAPFNEARSWKTSALMSLIAAILFLTCAATIFQDWATVKRNTYWPPNGHRLDLLCGTGAISVILTLVYILDLVITVLFGIRGEIE